jgi:hypothetical protein
MTTPRSLLIVKGAYRGIDPAFACLAHSAKPGQYAIIEFQGDDVIRRTILPHTSRVEVERYTTDRNFKGTVFVDQRKDSKLLPLTVGKHCIETDVNEYRRAKSDEEAEALLQLSRQTLQLLQSADSDKSFRGAIKSKGADASDLKSAFQRTETKGFIQYRAGLQDVFGRVSDHTRIVPKTPEWADRLDRTYRGLYEVASATKPGVTVAQLNNIFMKHMKPTDTVYGNVVHHIGYEPHEASVPLDIVQPYDVLAFGAVVGDRQTGENALIRAAVHSVKPPPPPPPNSHSQNVSDIPTNKSNSIPTYGNSGKNSSSYRSFSNTPLQNSTIMERYIIPM